jgi:hypothetical protein
VGIAAMENQGLLTEIPVKIRSRFVGSFACQFWSFVLLLLWIVVVCCISERSKTGAQPKTLVINVIPDCVVFNNLVNELWILSLDLFRRLHTLLGDFFLIERVIRSDWGTA